MISKIVYLVLIVSPSLSNVIPTSSLPRWQDACGGQNRVAANSYDLSSTVKVPSVITISNEMKTRLYTQSELLKTSCIVLKENMERIHFSNSDPVYLRQPSLIPEFPATKTGQNAIEASRGMNLDTYIQDYGELSRVAMFIDLVTNQERNEVLLDNLAEVNERIYALLCTMKTVIDANSGRVVYEDIATAIPAIYTNIENNAIRHYRDYIIAYKTIEYSRSLEYQYSMIALF